MKPAPALVILAAGQARRYGDLKQLVDVGGGHALLEFTVYDALQAGFEHIVLVIQGEQDRRFAQQLSPLRSHAQVSFVHQDRDPLVQGLCRAGAWGTGHAVLATREAVDGSFAVANADDYYGPQAFELLRHFFAQPRRSRPPRFAVVTMPVENTLSAAAPVNRALVIERRGAVDSIEELIGLRADSAGEITHAVDDQRLPVRSEDLVSMNLWGLNEQVFPLLATAFQRLRAQRPEAELFLPDAISGKIAARQCSVQPILTDGPWCGLTVAADLEQTRTTIGELTAAGHFPANLWGQPISGAND